MRTSILLVAWISWSSVSFADPGRLAKIAEDVSGAMQPCTDAFQQLAVEMAGPRERVALLRLSAATKQACEEAEERLVAFESPAASYNVKEAVQTYLRTWRSIASFRQAMSNLSRDIFRIADDPTFSSDAKTRLTDSRVRAFNEALVRDRSQEEAAADLLQEAMRQLANEEGKPAAKRTRPSKAAMRDFTRLTTQVADVMSPCDTAYDLMRAAQSTGAKGRILLDQAQQAKAHCSSSRSKLTKVARLKKASPEAEDLQEEWLSKIEEAARYQVDAAQALIWYAEEGRDGHLPAYRSSRLAATVTKRDAKDLSVELKRVFAIE